MESAAVLAAIQHSVVPDAHRLFMEDPSAVKHNVLPTKHLPPFLTKEDPARTHAQTASHVVDLASGVC